MKTLKPFLMLVVILCCSFYANAQILCGVQAAFTQNINPNNVASFYDTSRVDANWQITSWQWNFGDGSPTSSLQNPTHTYTAPGTYNVCLIVTATGIGTTCTSDICHTVIVGAPGCGNTQASFSITGNGPTVVLQSTSTGISSGTLYEWWMDGNAITNPNPNTAFTLTNVTTGSHTFCLYVYANLNTFCDSACRTEYIGANPCHITAAWSYSILGNDSVRFEAADTNAVSGHGWNFGDGSTGGGLTTTHHYANSGTYHVCFYIYLPGVPNCVDSLCQNITIPNPSCGTASFNYYIHGDTSIHAYSTSTGVDTSTYYYWYVRGANGNLIQTQAGHNNFFASQGLNPGTYRVCLYIYTHNQSIVCDSACQSVTIANNTPCGNLQANFTISQSGTAVALVSTSTGTNTGTLYQWWMDGTSLTNPNPNTAYTISNVATGNHTFCLYVYANANTFCDSTCRTEHIGSNTCNITAAWQFMVHTSWVSFYPSANTPAGVVHHWNFGDGSDSTYTTNIAWLTHSFPVLPNNMYYRVCQYVELPGTNCVDSMCQYVLVPGVGNPPCGVAAFNFYLAGSSIHAYSTSTGVDSTTQYQWYIWGPNNVLVQTQTGHNTYIVSQNLLPGTYQVCLYLYSANQTFCDSACRSITIAQNTNPCAHITANWIYSIFPNDTVHFVTRDTNTVANHYWNFGDGSSGSGMEVNHHYVNPGTYHVCSYVYIPGIACVDSFCQYVTISGSPCSTIDASWTQTYLQNGGVHFTGVSNSQNVYNHWDFGDGSSSTLNDPTHYYSTAGLFTVCHIVSIPGTICADTNCHSIQANHGNPCNGFGVNISSGPNQNGGGFFAEAIIVNGTPGLSNSFAWSNGATTQRITVTQPGIYCVTVYDGNQCSASTCDTVGTIPTNCQAGFTWHFINCNTVEFVNTSTGNSLRQYWTYGDGSPADTARNPHHTFPVGTWTVQLTIYNSATQCQSAYHAVITVQPCGGYDDTICGVVFNDYNNNGTLDSGETTIANTTVYIDNSIVNTDGNGHYIIYTSGGSHFVHVAVPTGCALTIPIGNNNGGFNYGGYYIPSGGGTFCGYDFGINCSIVHICGVVFFDANNNGTQDNGEAGIPNVPVLITGTNGVVHHATTNSAGEYCETLPAGTYTVTIGPNSYPGGVVTPQSITVIATTNGTTYGGNNFAVYVQPGACDLSINITPHTTITAGFSAWYSIQVCNIGASVSDGSVALYYDPAVIFDHSSPLQTTQNSSTHTVTWDFTNLLPGHCLYYWVAFTADTPLTVGQFVFTLANVTPGGTCNDVNMVNNIDTVHQAVTASWDPNNKLVFPLGEGPEGRISGTQELTYNINFQNTGDAPAVNVVLRDMISNDLDLSTFRMIGSSHPFTMQFNGREAVWKFSGIMLPTQMTDEEHSHGFVSFAITPVQGLPQGTQLLNNAGIYFDYNQPVITNTTLNTIDYALSVAEIENGKATITLQPNPFSEFTTIKIEGAEAPYELKVFDMLGNLVKNENANSNTFSIDRGNMAAGVYMYQVLKSNKIIGKGKMVAE